MDITIRQERNADCPVVYELIERAFRCVPESDHREQYLVGRLRKSSTFIPSLSLVAETDDGKIVGYVLLTEVTIVSDGRSVPSLGVAPLAVLPEFQGRGIGGMLLREAHERAVRLGYGIAVLLGHKDYYSRFGYRRAIDRGIEFPFNVPRDCCMVLELAPGALDGIEGTVCYPDEFR